MRSRSPAFRSLVLAALGAAALPALAGAQPGLRPAPDALISDLPWTARLGLRVSASAPPGLDSKAGSRLTGLNVMGDLFFESNRRFRATGGLMLGTRGPAWSGLGVASSSGLAGRPVLGGADESAADSADTGTVPYLGIGYSDASLRGGWGFSADLGVVALTPRSAVRLGRVLSGQQNFDDLLRELRLTPTVQVGVSYSF